MPTDDSPPPVLSVVVPLLNEEQVLANTLTALREVMDGIGEPYELIFVDDGSTDGSRGILARASADDPRVRVVCLSRNFGHEMATTAGLHHARGQAAVVIDADLQDPPELIPVFVAKWREGYHVAYGVRVRREGESWAKRLTAFLFYRLIRALSDVTIPPDTGDFRIMDRRVIDVYRLLREDPRFFRGLIPWIGFKQIGVPFVRKPRAGGYSKYRAAKLFRLAYDTITSFSTVTALVASLIGLGIAAVSFALLGLVLALWVVRAIDLDLWMIAALGFLALWNVQFLFLTMLGEYLVRTHRLAQSRPLYVVDVVIESGRAIPPTPPPLGGVR